MNLTQDLRIAGRRLSNTPLFTLVAVTTLALAIGASAALFSLLDQVVLRRLPVEQPEQLVVLSNRGDWQGRVNVQSDFSAPFSFPMYRALREGSRVTQDLLARTPVSLSLAWTPASATGSGSATPRAEVVDGELVTGNYFSLLGLVPAVGRLLSPLDDTASAAAAEPAVVLSHAAWRNRFAGDPSIVGRGLSINGVPMTVVGVAPRDFDSVQVGLKPEVFVPMATKARVTPRENNLDDERFAWADIVARLRPGVSLEQARVQLQTVFQAQLAAEAARQSWSERLKEEYRAKQLAIFPGARGRSDFRGSSANGLMVLLALVGLVLLVACANLANLLATRASARRREVSVRLALGASRWDTLRELWMESLLLAGLGGVAGVALAAVLLGPGLELLGAGSLARAFDYRIDARLLSFVAAVSLGAGALLGLLPVAEVARGARAGLSGRLREDAAGSGAGRRGIAARRALVALQVGLSTVVLVGAALFARSLDRLLALDAGYRVADTVTFGVDPMQRGASLERAGEIDRRIGEALAAVPGVEAVASSTTGFLSNSTAQTSIEIEGKAPSDDDPSPRYAMVSAGFHRVVGWRLVEGRDFDERDGKAAPRVAIVNQAMARAFFPDGAIGRKFRRSRPGEPWVEVVGVARDAHWADTRDEAAEAAYFLPWEQAFRGQGMTFYVHTRLADGVALDAVRRAVAGVDPELPIVGLGTFARQVETLTSSERFLMRFSILFGAVATLLAGLGLYGVLSYAVERRRREIGLRAALGATPREIVRRVLGDGARPVGIGLLGGLILALGGAKLAGGLLYGISAWDPMAYAVAPPLLVAVAGLAAWLPARRAGKLDPARALREE
jgi:putative ABC transport system permease protein